MDLVYTLTRSSARRKLTISIERDRSVVVHAPTGISEESIHRLIEKKRRWIYEKIEHPQKYQSLPHPPGKELVNGESALYLGRQYRIEIVKRGLGQIRFAHGFFVPGEIVAERQDAFRAWYVNRAKEIFVPRVKKYAKALGVEYGITKVVDKRYRWGSCSMRNNVSLNWRLIKAPMFVIDYVIVHELAHLIEANHTTRFWNVVRSQLANVEKAKTWLKENGQLLEQII